VFYKWCMGLDVPGFHFRVMSIQFLIVCAVVGICALWLRREMNTPTRRLMTFALVAFLAALASGVDWVDSGRSLPLLVLVLGVILGAKYKSALRHMHSLRATCELQPSTGNSGQGSPAPYQSLTFPLLWSVFAF